MTIWQAVRECLGKYHRFDGRASRAELRGWLLGLAAALAGSLVADGLVAAPLLGFPFFAAEAGRPLTVIAALLLTMPTAAVCARRLHDVGRSAGWLMLVFAPVLGWAVLAWWMSRPSQARVNRHGEPAEELERL